MATHSSVLAWRIPGMGEPDGLPSMWLHRVGHDWSDLAAAAPVIQSEWSKSKREKQIYINRYMWSLEKWYGWSYFQGRNRDPPGENRHMERVREGKERMNGESSPDILTPCVSQTASGNLLSSTGSSALWWREGQDGGEWEGGCTGRAYMHTHSWNQRQKPVSHREAVILQLK